MVSDVFGDICGWSSICYTLVRGKEPTNRMTASVRQYQQPWPYVPSSRLGPATKLLYDLQLITSPLWISLERENMDYIARPCLINK
jgi:hypothetical protein